MHFFVAWLFSIARNDPHIRPSRPTPTFNEPADYLRTQRINYSCAKMHATEARALTPDPLSFDAPFLENPSEYPHKPYIARN